MTTLLMILGGCLVGLIVGLIDRGPTSKGWKPKKSRPKGRNSTTYPGYTSYSHEDPPGWGTPHGY